MWVLQPYQSGLLFSGLISPTQEYRADIKTWMIQNRLQMNDKKTKLVLTCPQNCIDHPSLPYTFHNQLIYSFLCFCPLFRFHSWLEFDFLSHFSSLQTSLSETTNTHCVLGDLLLQFPLAGSPNLLDSPEWYLSADQILIICSACWLAISDRTVNKLSTLTYSTVSGTGPVYLTKSLLSTASSIFWHQTSLNPTKTKTYGQQSFSYQAPWTWNKLPISLHHADSFDHL